MKRELVIHFSFLVAFFIFIALFRQYFEFRYLLFLFGGLVGTFLPDVDHLIYVYASRPHELTSQRVNFMLAKREWLPILNLLYMTRSERKQLVFHSAFFQIIFTILAFWVLTSSGSLFGRGLVLAFSLHLLVDQIVDLTEVDSLDNWFNQSPLVASLSKQKATLYWLANLIIILIFGFLL
ncbi:hypothetical protein A2975_00265 [Candidatus Woesebacteria bacterium RIFCSPLOWO2_01_FULL_44_14]|uniref:Uncharacterized protein n=1 Tax=Candidatus Woesebacteria bacterium RIFCSPLOWO2_01_FULL_44_14 TaxID=1802525 RepID=A0A1F8C0C0_9BACT|nr:MAG: hypothetical protein A2975_00265 [Candidatus Woesebacteria bacterium RIFCSPLOWO2_01_FULL_44_14]